jgi:vancomycin resistance protein YoaR
VSDPQDDVTVDTHTPAPQERAQLAEEPEASAPSRPRLIVRWVTLGLLSAAMILGALYGLAVWRVSSNEVPTGSSVDGVRIGDMSAEQAAEKLADRLGDKATAAIPVTVGGTAGRIVPADAGLSVDWHATAENAGARVYHPAALWARLTNGRVSVEPVITVDEAKLDATLAELAARTASKPTEPTITFTGDGQARLTPGRTGITLQADAAAQVLRAAYFSEREQVVPVALPVDAAAPTVSDGQAGQVLTSFARPAVAAPVTVRVEGTDVQATAGQIARALTFDVANGTLVPRLRAKKLRAQLADELDPLESAGTNARIVIRNDKPVIISSKKGLTVPADELATAVQAVLPNAGAAQRVAVVELEKSAPSFTTTDAKALNITEKLSSFWQYFPPAAYRYQNVGQAAAYINGSIIKPGDVFSMNDTIHERTPANGYTKGFIISGSRFREELGGGVSIITTAMWTAGFYAGLERVEQHTHGLYISRYKAGLEATVAWGYIDLKMRNDTGNGVLITAERYSNGVRIEMWGTKKWDKVTSSFTNRYNYTGFSTITDDSPTCVESSGSSGFSIAVTRRRYIDGEVVSKETWPATYRPTPHVVCTNPAATSA